MGKRQRLFCVMILSLVSGCGKGVSAYHNCPEKPLSYLPMADSDIRGIVPLGNVAPAWGHVYPTNHVYFYMTLDSNQKPIPVPVYAPRILK